MRQQGSSNRATKVKKKQLKVIYSFTTKDAFKTARTVFTTKRCTLDQGIFIDKQENTKLKEKRQVALEQARGGVQKQKAQFEPDLLLSTQFKPLAPH